MTPLILRQAQDEREGAADRGEVSLKGFDDPVRLHEVRWPEEA